MSVVSILINKIIVMAAMIVLGFVLKRNKTINDGFVKDSSKILASIVSPVVVISSFLSGYSEERQQWLLISTFWATIIIVLSILITLPLLKKDARVERFGAIASNCGFIGVPLVQAAFGNDAVFCVASSVALYNVFYWTIGLYLMTGDQKAISFKKIVTNPCIIAFALGVLIFLLKIDVPELITSGCSTFTGMTLPLSSIVIGANMSSIDLKKMIKEKTVLLACALRLFIIPLLAVLVLKLVGSDYYLLKYGLLVVIGAPSAANTTVFATIFNQDKEKGAAIVCLSSLLCVISIPLMVIVSDLIW